MATHSYRPARAKNTIPGTTGKRIPSSSRISPAEKTGGLFTNVPFQNAGATAFRERHRQQVRDTKGRFAGQWGFAWQGLQGVDNAIADLDERMHANLQRGAEALKDQMVEYMKENAKWEDHSREHEDARDNLQGAVVWQDRDHFSIFLGHGANVYYGIWLEVRFGGRFAIIVPTVEHFRQQGIGTKLVTLT